MAKHIAVDEQRCLACKQCMVECALAHSKAASLVEALAQGADLNPRVHVEPVGEFGMPMQCRHCDDAPCVAVCPTRAIYRAEDRGLVLLDQNRCIGCTYCVFACPFGVIDMSSAGKGVIKCDLCMARTDAGQPPACVAGCPTKALKLVEMDEWIQQRRRQAAAALAGAGSAASPTGAGKPPPGEKAG